MKKISLLTNENGSVIVLALIMLVLLTLLGMAVSRTSSIGVQIASNDSQAADNLYKAESADHYAIELSDIWMTDTFLEDAYKNPASVQVVIPTLNLDPNDIDNDGLSDVNLDIDGDGNNDIRIEIRCIERNGAYIGTLSAAANDLPSMRYSTVPPVGSGYSLKYFAVRNFGITGTALNGGTVVQLGAYKVFNK